VESITNNSKIIVRHRRRSSLTGIDFLVIAAIVLTFAAIVSTTVSRAKASTHNGASSPAFSSDLSQLPDQIPEDPGLIKARIGLAAAGRWM